ncbi:MAG TPA: pyridoxamine 5'-phosphate oxidase family protein [Desulfobacteraceae bacterium]|nr:pyridoxamine 5'-phosphate oxidase family protein [Desulfobacteraceae bacterium]
MDRQQLRQAITELLAGQRLAVLATSDRGRPYASLVAFSVADDLQTLYFATSRKTNKYANLTAEPRAALLIDSRRNRADDLQQAAAVTVLGTAGELEGEEKKRQGTRFLARHPSLREFIEAPSTALFAVRVENYKYVSRFQEVFAYLPEPE